MDVLAPAGYASPPNRAGRATTCVTWDTDALNPSEGLRFEVARAMDNTILTTHLRDWQLGKIQIPNSIPVVEGPMITCALVSIDLTDPNGLIKALIIPSAPVVDPNIFRKGRLVKNGKYFQVTVMKTFDSVLQILLRGQLPPASILGVVTIEAPPDYSAVADDIASLQALAAQVPDAFALVSGVPLRTNQFTDDIAGIGRNRFFYRVRAVDAAENRSDWSPISAPFFQVDTTPPETPRFLQVLGGDRKVVLKWNRDPDPAIHYQIFRSRSPGALESTESLSPISEIIADPTTLEAEYTDEPLEGTLGDGRYYYSLSAVKSVRRGAAANDFIEVRTPPSPIASAQVLDTSPPAVPNWITAQWWDEVADHIALPDTSSPTIRLEWESGVSNAIQTLERSQSAGLVWQEVAQGPPFNAPGSVAAPNRWITFDRNLDPTLSYSYRIKVRNQFGRETVGPSIAVTTLR